MPVRTLNDLLVGSREAADRAEALTDLAIAEERDLTEAENAEFDGYLAEARRLRETYDAEVLADQRAARQAQLLEARAALPGAPSYGSGSLIRQSNVRVSQMVDRIMADPKRHFASLGEFALTVYNASSPANMIPDDRLMKMQAAASGLNVAQGSQGGFAWSFPPAFSQMLWDGMQQMPENLMNMTDQYTVTGESLTFPANGETSRATGSRYGGVRGYWLAEAAQMTASLPTVRRMKLEPQALGVLVYVTDQLLANAPAIDQYIRRAGTEEILFLVNNAIIAGNGVGQPLGTTTSPAAITVTKEIGQAARTVVVENINRMYARLHTRCRSGAVWFVNQDVEPALDAMGLTVGTAGFPVFLSTNGGFPSLVEQPQRRLKGLPVIPLEYCETLGTVGDIILTNLNYYALGTRGTQVQEAMSIHLRFDYNEVAFRLMFAVDGQSWLGAPLTPFKGTSTLSSTVLLATRA